MIENHFLWPKSHRLRAVLSSYHFTPVSVIEEKLRHLFPSGYPVLCSSGRSALMLALLSMGVNRSSSVGVFAYASHCVLDAISRVATPLPGPTGKFSDVRVVYHQWGYVQEVNLPPNTIEDCVDTLCIPGAKLFPGGGGFEIWSLPKILGTTSGGILWCRNVDTALQIRQLRDERHGSLVQWIIRLLSIKYPVLHNYWNGGESSSGRPSRLQTGDIWDGLSRWDAIVLDRLEKISLLSSLVVDWLPKPADRLPSVIPIISNVAEKILIDLGLSAGYRTIERFSSQQSCCLHKIVPLPIHQDVSINWIKEVVTRI